MNQPDPQRRIAGGVEYELTRRRVRNLNIRVRTDGSVAVSAPRRVPLSSVDAFVAAHAGSRRAKHSVPVFREQLPHRVLMSRTAMRGISPRGQVAANSG